MEQFYHIARQEYLDDILGAESVPGQGLKPRSITGKHGWNNSLGNPDYIYLIKTSDINGFLKRKVDRGAILAKDGIEKAVLRVDLPEDHPVERDYDQIMSLYKMSDENVQWKLGSTREVAIVKFFKAFGIDFEGDFDEDNIKTHFDRIPATVYDQMIGLYRTNKSIPAENLEFVQPLTTE